MRNKLILFFLLTLCSGAFVSAQTFTKHPENPVLQRTTQLGSWDAIALSDPHVLMVDDTLMMWYTGVGWLDEADSVAHQRIGMARSTDGINWIQYADNPVLDRTEGSWDDLGVETSSVLIDELAPFNKRFKMWYAGQNSKSGMYQLGYAYSSNGLNWTKSSANPVLETGPANSWENGFLEGPCVLLHNDTLRMWYASIDLVGDGSLSDFTGNIGYAWSIDGESWNKHSNNPVLTSFDSPSWDQASVADPHVIRYNNEYLMVYAGLNSWANEQFKMGMASSHDGVNWTRIGASPIVDTGEGSDWDAEDAAYGCFVFNENLNNFQLWYTGIDSTSTPIELTDYSYEIGCASSEVIQSIYQVIKDPSFSLYPNPATRNVTISFNSGDFSFLQISDMKGRVLYSKELNSNKQIVDVSNFLSGCYIVKVIGKERVVAEVLLIR